MHCLGRKIQAAHSCLRHQHDNHHRHADDDGCQDHKAESMFDLYHSQRVEVHPGINHKQPSPNLQRAASKRRKAHIQYKRNGQRRENHHLLGGENTPFLGGFFKPPGGGFFGLFLTVLVFFSHCQDFRSDCAWRSATPRQVTPYCRQGRLPKNTAGQRPQAGKWESRKRTGSIAAQNA